MLSMGLFARDDPFWTWKQFIYSYYQLILGPPLCQCCILVVLNYSYCFLMMLLKLLQCSSLCYSEQHKITLQKKRQICSSLSLTQHISTFFLLLHAFLVFFVFRVPHFPFKSLLEFPSSNPWGPFYSISFSNLTCYSLDSLALVVICLSY